MSASNPIILVKNNTDFILKASLAGNFSNTADISNQRTRYTYNITSETFAAAAYVSIQAKTSSAAAFTTYTVPLLSANAQGVVDSLNALGFGTWATMTSGGVTTVVTWNDTYVFGDLTISDPYAIPINLNYNWAAPGALLQIRINGNIVLNQASPAVIIGLLTNASIGAVVRVNGQAPPADPIGFAAIKQTSSGSVIIHAQTLSPGESGQFQFTVESALSYDIDFS